MSAQRSVRLAAFFGSRWHGEVPLSRLFWRDIVVVGTLINVVATVLALISLRQGAPLVTVAALHFAPLPYNCFLCAAVWRWTPPVPWFRLGAALWLGASVVA